MRILLTGANGLLGQKLVRHIHKNSNHDFLATGRGKKRFKYPAGYQELDISNLKNVEDVFNDFKPDAVIHTAAMTNVDECELNKENCFLSNVTSVKILVEVAEKLNSFFLYLSTDFIFDGNTGMLDEDQQASPVNYYGETKLEAERIVMNSKIPWAIARTVLVYGIVEDMSRSNIILWVKNSLQEGKKINVVDDQWRTPTLAEDLADGCFRIVDQKQTGIFNISGKDYLTPYQMALKTADYFGLDKSLIQKTDSTIFTQPAKRPMRTGFDISKARTVLGYHPQSFEKGIETVAKQVQSIRP